jgi:hypothetical protein
LALSRLAATEAQPLLGAENPLLQDVLRLVAECYAVALPSLGFRPLFTTSPAPDEASWLFEHALTRYLVEGLPFSSLQFFCRSLFPSGRI